MPKIAATAELRIDGTRRHLYIDGTEFPWYTDGVSYERAAGTSLGYVTVRIPVERYREFDLTAEQPAQPTGDQPAAEVQSGVADRPWDLPDWSQRPLREPSNPAADADRGWPYDGSAGPASRRPIPTPPPGYEVAPDPTYRGETKPIGGGAELP